MCTFKRLACIIIYMTSLSACVSYQSAEYRHAQPYLFDNSYVYPEGYEDGYYGSDYSSQQAKPQVVVPDSYHVGKYHSPTSHKDRDRRWVDSQNPHGYTIELSRGANAASVAKTLYKAPKSDRMAQVKYQQHGQTQYKGLYGSYSSYEAAQEALKSLPDDIKQEASIQSWGSVQGQINN